MASDARSRRFLLLPRWASAPLASRWCTFAARCPRACACATSAASHSAKKTPTPPRPARTPSPPPRGETKERALAGARRRSAGGPQLSKHNEVGPAGGQSKMLQSNLTHATHYNRNFLEGSEHGIVCLYKDVSMPPGHGQLCAQCGGHSSRLARRTGSRVSTSSAAVAACCSEGLPLCRSRTNGCIPPACATCAAAAASRGQVLERARARGSDCACESDGGDSDGQGTPQGGSGVRSTHPLGSRSGTFVRCLGVKRPRFHEKNRHVIPQTQPTETD